MGRELNFAPPLLASRDLGCSGGRREEVSRSRGKGRAGAVRQEAATLTWQTEWKQEQEHRSRRKELDSQSRLNEGMSRRCDQKEED